MKFKRIDKRKPARKTMLEQRIELAKKLSPKAIDEMISKDINIFAKYLGILKTKARSSAIRDVLCGVGKERIRGTREGDELKRIVKEGIEKKEKEYHSDLFSMLRSANIIEKYKEGKGVVIEVKDQQRLLASAKIGRIIQKEEWEHIKPAVKKLTIEDIK